MIQFRCTCGKLMQAQSEYAGKRAKCPSCGEIVVVPSSGGTPQIAPGAPPQAPLPRAESREGFQSHRPAPPQSAENWPDDRQDRWDPEGRRPRTAQRRGMALWMKLLLLFIVIGVLAGGTWLLISLLGGKSGAQAVALVPRDGTGFATVRVADMWNSKGFEKVRAELGGKIDDMVRAEIGLGIGDIERVTIAVAEKNWEAMGPGFMPDVWGVVTTKVPVDQSKILNKLMKGHTENKAGSKRYYTSPETRGLAVHFASDKEVWIGAQPAIVGLLEGSRKISDSGPLSESLEVAASDRHHLVIGFQIPDKLRDMMKGIPGGPPELVALADIQGGRVTLDAGEAGLLEYRLRFGQESSAAAVARFLNDTIAKLKAEGDKLPPDMAMMMATAKKAMDSLKVETRGKELIVSLGGADGAMASMAALLVPAVQKVREAAARTQAGNNMRQVVLGMHAYHDVHKCLPPQRYKNGLSWRVAILPYVGQEHLYRKFRLDEPWDSPHNSKLVDEMPVIYQPVGGPPLARGFTPYQVVTGNRNLWHPVMDRKSRLHAIPDGSSNTVLVVESDSPRPWTAPLDVEYEPFGPAGMPRLGHQDPVSFLVGMGDGTIRWIRRSIPPDTFNKLICPNDGMPLPDDF